MQIKRFVAEVIRPLAPKTAHKMMLQVLQDRVADVQLPDDRWARGIYAEELPEKKIEIPPTTFVHKIHVSGSYLFVLGAVLGAIIATLLTIALFMN